MSGVKTRLVTTGLRRARPDDKFPDPPTDGARAVSMSPYVFNGELHMMVWWLVPLKEHD